MSKRSGRGQKNLFFVVMVLAAGALFGCALAIFVLIFLTGGFIDPVSSDALNQSVAVTTLALLNTTLGAGENSAESSPANLIQFVNWRNHGVTNKLPPTLDFVVNADTAS